MKSKSHLKLRALCEGAVMVALAQVLSYVKLFELPQGGSVGIGMLPIFIYCARWGFGPGMLASVVYSFLQLMFDGGFAIGWQSVLGDYIIAYSVLGLAGLFHKNKYGLLIGTAVGCAARFLVHYIVGATVWGEYMPDTFFGMTMTTPWFYSALYNGSYMLIDMIFCLLLGWLAYTVIGKYIRGEDIRIKDIHSENNRGEDICSESIRDESTRGDDTRDEDNCGKRVVLKK